MWYLYYLLMLYKVKISRHHLFPLWRCKTVSIYVHLVFFWTSFSFVQSFSWSAAHELPDICHLTVEMLRGLVPWVAGWLTLHFCSCVACLHVLKIQYITDKIGDDKREENSSLYCQGEQTNITSKWNEISILSSFQGRERCFPPELKKENPVNFHKEKNR